MPEAIERRVLGALHFFDAGSGLPVRAPLQLSSEGLVLRRNASGNWIIWSAHGLEAHGGSFAAAPASPAVDLPSYAIDIRDRSGAYLPRRYQLKLPRDPDPAHADQEASLFKAQPVRLYPSGAVPTAPNWALARITVQRTGSAERIANAFVRISTARAGVAVARGLSDAAGEALVVIPGIPKLMASGSGSTVVTAHVDAMLCVVVDTAVARFVAPEQLLAARIRTLRAQGPYPDPDDLEERANALVQVEQNIQLSSGAALHLNVQVSA